MKQHLEADRDGNVKRVSYESEPADLATLAATDTKPLTLADARLAKPTDMMADLGLAVVKRKADEDAAALEAAGQNEATPKGETPP